jgi:hypothetical protein
MAESGQDQKSWLRRRRERRRQRPEKPRDSPERTAERAEEAHLPDAAKEPNRWELPPAGGVGG